MTASVSPYPIELDKFVKKRQWEEAVRLCRFVKSDPLWAALAGGAIGSLHLDTADIALAARKEVAKLHYILYIKDIPLEEGQNAEIALYQRRPDEAERILLQANPPLVYRAIKMNIRLFRWKRALQIAEQHKKHIDTVLYYRQKFLTSHNRSEEEPRFKELFAEVEINEDAIAEKKAKEHEEEERLADARELEGRKASINIFFGNNSRVGKLRGTLGKTLILNKIILKYKHIHNTFFHF